MTNIQSYLDTFYFLIEHTNILGNFSIVLIVSIILGALVLDRFKIWRWAIVMTVYLILTQYQVDAVLRALGFTTYQVIQPLMVSIISSIFFATGSGIGYYIKKKFELAYTRESPEAVAKEVIAEVNGGVIENSTLIN
jgi:hypothetical protein